MRTRATIIPELIEARERGEFDIQPVYRPRRRTRLKGRDGPERRRQAQLDAGGRQRLQDLIGDGGVEGHRLGAHTPSLTIPPLGAQRPPYTHAQ